MLAELSELLSAQGIDPLLAGFLAGLGLGALLRLGAGKRSAGASGQAAPAVRGASFARALTPHTALAIQLEVDGGERLLGAELTAQLTTALRRGDKVGAIKALRAASGLDLKQAKDLVEALASAAQPR